MLYDTKYTTIFCIDITLFTTIFCIFIMSIWILTLSCCQKKGILFLCSSWVNKHRHHTHKCVDVGLFGDLLQNHCRSAEPRKHKCFRLQNATAFSCCQDSIKLPKNCKKEFSQMDFTVVWICGILYT